MAPAIQSTRPDVAPTLKDQAGNVLGGHGRLRKGLVASQIAISLLLVIGAALFTRTLGNLLATNLASFPGEVVPVGSGASLRDVDGEIDLAVVAVPAHAVPAADNVDAAAWWAAACALPASR